MVRLFWLTIIAVLLQISILGVLLLDSGENSPRELILPYSDCAFPCFNGAVLGQLVDIETFNRLSKRLESKGLVLDNQDMQHGFFTWESSQASQGSDADLVSLQVPDKKFTGIQVYSNNQYPFPIAGDVMNILGQPTCFYWMDNGFAAIYLNADYTLELDFDYYPNEFSLKTAPKRVSAGAVTYKHCDDFQIYGEPGSEVLRLAITK